MATYSLDRIESDRAVLIGEDGSSVVAFLSELPEGIKEGNVVRYENGVYTLDVVEEQQRRSRILSLQDKIRRKNS